MKNTIPLALYVELNSNDILYKIVTLKSVTLE